jgi:hypothetical protein
MVKSMTKNLDSVKRAREAAVGAAAVIALGMDWLAIRVDELPPGIEADYGEAFSRIGCTLAEIAVDPEDMPWAMNCTSLALACGQRPRRIRSRPPSG